MQDEDENRERRIATQGKYALERGSTFLSSFAIVLFPPGGAPARRDMAPRVWAHTPGKA
jgi:hypothetical protein